jgi:hypothetical protein
MMSLLASGMIMAAWVGAPAATGTAAGPPAYLLTSLREELPDALAAAAPDSTRYSGPEGSFELTTGEMDGSPPEEGLLVIHDPGKPVRVVFLATSGDEIVREEVKLPRRESGDVSARYLPFADGKALGQVRGSPGNSVLVAWNGHDEDVVWKSARDARDEDRWFELDDLDGDGIREIVTYQRRAMDATAEDEFEQEAQGAAPTEQASPVAVLQWNGKSWEKNDRLLRRHS